MNCQSVSDIVSTCYEKKCMKKIAKALKQETNCCPKVGIICGNYLEDIYEEGIQDCKDFTLDKIPHFPKKIARNFDCTFCFGKICGVEVVCVQAEDYENFPCCLKMMLLLIIKYCGISNLVVTTIGSGVCSNCKEGDIMTVRDYIDLPSLTGVCCCDNGICGEILDMSCLSMTCAFDKACCSRVDTPLVNTTCSTFCGVLACVADDSCQTPATAKMMEKLGAAALACTISCETKFAFNFDVKLCALVLVTNCFNASGNCKDDYCEDNIKAVVKMRHSELKTVISCLVECMSKCK